MLVVVILVVAAVIVAAVVLGKKSNEASYIIFPCRVCHSPQQVAVAETMRRVQEAHAKGQLAELGKHKISCMKCGAVQTSDWLMHPKTRSLINELDAGVYRDQTTTEYMKLVAADSPGAPGLDAAASAPAQSPVAAPPVKPG